MSPIISPTPSLRTLIFKTTRPKEVTTKIEQLESAYLRAHKRKLPVDLFMATWGQQPHAEYGINAHYSPDQQAAVDFLKGQAAA